MNEKQKVARLIEVFNRTFSDYNTRLVLGNDEPIYLPKNARTNYHQIVFAHGYFSSALHEIAHWCIAGEHRRQLIDYGYWYEPDGRNAKQQQAFEHVERKPQAIEWAFAMASGHTFRVSTDNLNGCPVDSSAFAKAVEQQLEAYRKDGFPARAQHFITVLTETFNTQALNMHSNRKCYVT